LWQAACATRPHGHGACPDRLNFSLAHFRTPFNFQGNLNWFQTFKIRIKFNACPKFMKLVSLFFKIHVLSKKNIQITSGT
jgi:hypothetical protein